jgi:hypothetical protein
MWSMKTMVLSVVSCVALYFVFVLNGMNKTLIGDNKNLEKMVERLESDGYVATRLANRTWYVVDSVTVSSGKNGEGELVKLPGKLMSRGSHLGIIHVVKNIQVRFFPANYKTSMYLILECLAYEYENERLILLGK